MSDTAIAKGKAWARRLIAVFVALWAAGSLATAADTVQLQATAVKQDLLVGEPLVLMVTMKTGAKVAIDGDLTWREAPLKVLIDRGQGFVPYREKRWVSGWREGDKGLLAGGQITLEYVLSYDDNLKDSVFPAPVTYRLVVEYRDDAIGPFRSNVVTLSVQAPSGDEQTVHDVLRRLGPEVSSIHQADRLSPDLADLVRRFPRSVYLQELRLNDLDARHSRVASGYHPDEPPVAGTADDPPPRPDLRPGVVSERLAGLVPLASEIAEVPGPFQANSLLVLAGLYAGSGDDQSARQTYERIVREFPNREAAKLALQEVGDTTPPAIEVTVSPSALWPPNKKLVPVTVAVTVNDDTDPEPAVRLVSITCDDGCDVSQDIAEAALNTDDRSFQLRATRKGGGTGRTYTITYSATDASANQTTARTTVRVPHDQSK